MFHLFPFTLAELANRNISIEAFLKDPLHLSMEQAKRNKEIWNMLSTISGFPEPYLSGKATTYRRWSNTYSHQLIREDIRDIVDIRSIADVETLYLLLPSKTCSPLSVPSLANDLKVSYNTVRNWLEVFERFFLVFSIPTWTERITRTIQKEKQEVDFLLANDNEPFLLIETKMADEQPSKSLQIFQRALNVPAIQLTNEGDSYRFASNDKNKILIAPAYQWLSQLP